MRDGRAGRKWAEIQRFIIWALSNTADAVATRDDAVSGTCRTPYPRLIKDEV